MPDSIAKPRILLTCPPMIGARSEFEPLFHDRGYDLFVPEFEQTMSEADLIDLVPGFDGWIIGDDPATRAVLTAGKLGRLKACVKWGVGVDNVDFEACGDLGLPVTNTPGVFGREVADLALTYVLGLARESFRIDRDIRTKGAWPKPAGISTWGKTAGIVGFGDIGHQLARRLAPLDMKIVRFDPKFDGEPAPPGIEHRVWSPDTLSDLDFLIFTAPLTPSTHHMFNVGTLSGLKRGVRIVNVGRGPVIEQSVLLQGLETGLIHSAALDVFEVEPLAGDNPLRSFDRCIFGSHNASNTLDAVRVVSHKASQYLFDFLEQQQ